MLVYVCSNGDMWSEPETRTPLVVLCPVVLPLAGRAKFIERFRELDNFQLDYLISFSNEGGLSSDSLPFHRNICFRSAEPPVTLAINEL